MPYSLPTTFLLFLPAFVFVMSVVAVVVTTAVAVGGDVFMRRDR